MTLRARTVSQSTLRLTAVRTTALPLTWPTAAYRPTAALQS